MDTQANERLTPKPLHEHIPGAWNFVEPNPLADAERSIANASRLDISPALAAESVIAFAEPMEVRIKLSPEARRRLLSSMPVHDMLYHLADEACDELDNPEWREIEDALTEIFVPPQRFIVGMPAARDLPADVVRRADARGKTAQAIHRRG